MRQAEIRDLLISWITISLAFTILFSRLQLFNLGGASGLPLVGFLELFPTALVVTGTAFVLHELAHKYVAIHYGNEAEFRAWPVGLAFALILPLISGFVFAAPGATYVAGTNIDTRKNAIISLAGPLLNIVMAFLFLLLFFAVGANTLLSLTAVIGVQVNLFLALFNMLPVYPLDGSKVFAWRKSVWAVVFIPLLIVLFF